MRCWVARCVGARVACAISVALLAAATVANAAPSFEFIYETTDYPGGLSADGSKAIVDTSSIGGPMVVWHRDGSPDQPITGLPGYQFTLGTAISGDGAVVVGKSHGFGQTARAFRWTPAGGAVALIDPVDPTAATEALATNANGSVVVGLVQGAFDGLQHFHATRWTPAGGMQRLNGYQAYDTSLAGGVSSDGSVIVGTVQMYQPGVSISQAFRWTEAGGFQLLPDAPFRTWGYGLSGDGLTIVGSGEFGSGDSAFRWTQADGFTQFTHTIPYFQIQGAMATSADGSVIIGQGQSPRGYEAWIWDEAHGVRLLTDLASEMGFDLGGQYLESASAISADGTVIVGRSYGPLGGIGYMVVVPEPTAGALLLVVTASGVGMRRRR